MGTYLPRMEYLRYQTHFSERSRSDRIHWSKSGTVGIPSVGDTSPFTVIFIYVRAAGCSVRECSSSVPPTVKVEEVGGFSIVSSTSDLKHTACGLLQHGAPTS